MTVEATGAAATGAATATGAAAAFGAATFLDFSTAGAATAATSATGVSDFLVTFFATAWVVLLIVLVPVELVDMFKRVMTHSVEKMLVKFYDQ